MSTFSFGAFLLGAAGGFLSGALTIIAVTELLPRAAFAAMSLSSEPEPEAFHDSDEYLAGRE
jgi:hypothetical protein